MCLSSQDLCLPCKDSTRSLRKTCERAVRIPFHRSYMKHCIPKKVGNIPLIFSKKFKQHSERHQLSLWSPILRHSSLLTGTETVPAKRFQLNWDTQSLCFKQGLLEVDEVNASEQATKPYLANEQPLIHRPPPSPGRIWRAWLSLRFL